MKIIGVVENTSCSKSYKNEHGLSLYIETPKHRILFDLGPDDTFVQNAYALGIELEEIDIVIISHGHKDHGGGLEAFLEKNKKAKIYIQESAFIKHYIKVLGIHLGVALKQSLKSHPQIQLLNGNHIIDDELSLFIKPKLKEFMPEGNKRLYKQEEDKYCLDDFDHEQNLILNVEDKKVLITGCAHRGVTNIIEEAEEILQQPLDVVIGGFHLTDPTDIIKKSKETTRSIGEILDKKGYEYYACHCTGEVAYLQLVEILGDKIHYLRTGMIVEI